MLQCSSDRIKLPVLALTKYYTYLQKQNITGVSSKKIEMKSLLTKIRYHDILPAWQNFSKANSSKNQNNPKHPISWF